MKSFHKIIILSFILMFSACTPPSITQSDIQDKDINNDTDDINTDDTDIHDSDDTGDVTDITNNNNQTCEQQDAKRLHFMTKIYNGTDHPEICMLPAQQKAIGAIMVYNADMESWQNICTATLVGDKYVLTAAHCVLLDMYSQIPQDPSDLRFALGNDALTPDAMYEVASLYYNPEYDPFSDETGNDTGILILKTSPLIDDPSILPLPFFKGDNLDFLRGNYVQQVGFGTTEDDYYNSLKNWTPELVNDVNYNLGDIEVNGQNISSVCSGDSGGPTLYPLEGNIITILGTVSWGESSCVGIDHYALSSHDLDFINQHIPQDFNYCGNYDFKGQCENNTAVWCENGNLKVECCGTETGGCSENTDGNFRCVTPKDECENNLNYEGRCDGNTAVWCWGGKIRQRNCSVCNTACTATGNKLLGNYCISQ